MQGMGYTQYNARLSVDRLVAIAENENPSDWSRRGSINQAVQGWADKGMPCPLSIPNARRIQEGAPMNTANVARGEAIRSYLLDVARHCRDHGLLFPTRHQLADAIGICGEQARRHTAALVDAGEITIRRARHRRIRIEGVCP